MADQGRWFKLWVTAPSDPDLANLPLEDFARWCIFGAYMKVHGTEGTIEIRPPATALQGLFRVTDYRHIIDIIMRFPHCENRHDARTVTDTVTWRNWSKYQQDTTQAERAKQYRASRSKKRGEEKRGEEIQKSPPYPPNGGNGSAHAAEAVMPLQRPDPPGYVLSCGDCMAMLRELNDLSARAYTAPGRAGEWMHQAHHGRPVAEVLDAIRRQVSQLGKAGGKSRLLSPSVMFKPENWDTTINARGPAARLDEMEGM